MIPTEAIVVRKYDATTDEAFVYATWLKNYKHASYFAKRIKPSIFFAGHHKILNHILAKDTVSVFVAHPKDDINTMLGYLVCEMGEKPILHFTFVKEAFRKMGIATRLFAKANISTGNLRFTHWCFPVDELMIKYPDMIYDPYAF